MSSVEARSFAISLLLPRINVRHHFHAWGSGSRLVLTLTCLICQAFTGVANAERPLPQNAPGGYRNPWPSLYNFEYPGKGSKGQKIYNKLLIPNQTMQIGKTFLHDNQGNRIAEAKASAVGYVNGNRDGGINAGCITKLFIGGVETECVLMFAIDIVSGSGVSGTGEREPGSGSRSGWAPLQDLQPQKQLKEIQLQIRDRIDAIRPSLMRRRIQEMTVIDHCLPEEAAEWFVTPNRSASKSQGKAKYYFTRRGRLYGLINIPETGKQRFGVTYDIAPVGASFYRDTVEPEVVVPIYAPDSSVASKYNLRLVYGAFINNTGEKRFCWTNAECLR